MKWALETEKILPPKNDGFEKELPLWGDFFSGSMLNFGGVYSFNPEKGFQFKATNVCFRRH